MQSGPGTPRTPGTPAKLDLNLLTALDALLREGSVTGAARRLHLSTPAMSRTLNRIRRALGDPVLVRSGRHMVPTPRALELAAEVREVVERAEAVFRTRGTFELATLERTFTLVADDAMLSVIGLRLLERVRAQAPGVALRLVPEGSGEEHAVREGQADLGIGVPAGPVPGLRVETLFTDENVGVARRGHPLLTGEVTPRRYAAAEHVTSSRRGRLHGPIDELLAAHGLRRRVVASVPTQTAALLMVAETDLVGRTGLRLTAERARRLDLETFPIPLDLPLLPVAQLWHPRHEQDPAHAWLRGCVRELAHTLMESASGAVGAAVAAVAPGAVGAPGAGEAEGA